jgi:hypothetical protein
VTGIPTPKQFLEFVVSHFYPAVYQEMRLTEDQKFEGYAVIDQINATCITQGELSEIYRRISHFRIPSA